MGGKVGCPTGGLALLLLLLECIYISIYIIVYYSVLYINYMNY